MLLGSRCLLQLKKKKKVSGSWNVEFLWDAIQFPKLAHILIILFCVFNELKIRLFLHSY